MERFVKFEIHEYMDMYPQVKAMHFIGDTKEIIEYDAKAFAEDMNAHYSGGTTTFIKIMSAEEAKKYVDDSIAYEKTHWDDETSEDFVTQLTELYERCYNI